MSTSASIGFIGIGKMGSPMVRHLLFAGYPVHAFDTDTRRIAELEKRGVSRAARLREAAAKPVVFASLPQDAALHAVVFGDDGLLAAARPGPARHDFRRDQHGLA